MLGHAAGGRPAERLMARLGMPVSDDTILRHLKRQPVARTSTPPACRVVGIHDWSWIRGSCSGTLIVDVLLDRSVVGLHIRPLEAETFWSTFLKGLPCSDVRLARQPWTGRRFRYSIYR